VGPNEHCSTSLLSNSGPAWYRGSLYYAHAMKIPWRW
jgi:hypothetical protein